MIYWAEDSEKSLLFKGGKDENNKYQGSVVLLCGGDRYGCYGIFSCYSHTEEQRCYREGYKGISGNWF